MSSRKAALSRPLPIFKRTPVDVNLQAPSTERSCRMVPLEQRITSTFSLTFTSPLAYSMLTDNKDSGDDENSQRASNSRSILPVRGGLLAQSLDLLKGAVYSNHPCCHVSNKSPSQEQQDRFRPGQQAEHLPF